MHFISKVLKKHLGKAVQMDCLMYKATAALTDLPGLIPWLQTLRGPFLVTSSKSENTLQLIKQMNLCLQSESKRAKVKKPNATFWWTPAFPGNDLFIHERWFLHYLTTKNQSWIYFPVKSWSLCNGEESVPQTVCWKFHAHSDKGSQIL